MFPRNGKHSINRTALPERTSPSPPCHSMWKSAWAIKQNPRFCLYLNFPLVFFSQTTWCWAEPVSVDREWHMRIAGSDAVLVLFVLFFLVNNSSSCNMLQKMLLQNQEIKGFTKVSFILVPLIAIPHSFEADLWDTISSSPRGPLKPLKHTVLVSANTSPHLLNTPCAWSCVLIVWCMALCMWTRGSHHKQLHLQEERVPPASLSMLICKWASTCLCLKT